MNSKRGCDTLAPHRLSAQTEPSTQPTRQTCDPLSPPEIVTTSAISQGANHHWETAAGIVMPDTLRTSCWVTEIG
jgi:hypothetical protein